MSSLLTELLDEAVDYEGLPIPLESVEARFIIQNYSHVLDAEETVGELTFNAKKKGWSDEARKAAALKRKRKAVVAADRVSKASAKGASELKKPSMPSVKVKKGKDGKFTMMDGSPLPKHIPHNIPPAWKNVLINPDPKAGRLVTGYDKKGKEQPLYSAEHKMRNKALDFAKVQELRKKKPAILNEVRKDIRNPKTKEPAIILALIAHTGIRPGSDTDTKAAKQAYGATTLRARHISNDGTTLRFTGKKGVSLVIKVNDPLLRKTLVERKKSRGADDKVFDADSKSLLKYTKSKDGGGFVPKNFRTAKGTEEAIAAMARMKPPTTQKEYEKFVNQVGDHVSGLLGNTRVEALRSYIDPAVWAKWRVK